MRVGLTEARAASGGIRFAIPPYAGYSALRGLGRRNRERSRRFKHASPRLFRLLKTAGIVVALWVLLLALWPLLR